LPERSTPVSVPFATTPVRVARKLEIFAVSDSRDDLTPWVDGRRFAVAGSATTAATASADKAAATSLRIVSSS
jgi:hypothetical protein